MTPPVRGDHLEVLLNEPALAGAVEEVKFKVSSIGLCPAQMLLTGATELAHCPYWDFSRNPILISKAQVLSPCSKPSWGQGVGMCVLSLFVS